MLSFPSTEKVAKLWVLISLEAHLLAAARVFIPNKGKVYFLSRDIFVDLPPIGKIIFAYLFSRVEQELTGGFVVLVRRHRVGDSFSLNPYLQ